MKKVNNFFIKHLNLLTAWAAVVTIIGGLLSLFLLEKNEEIASYKELIINKTEVIEKKNLQIIEYQAKIDKLENNVNTLQINGNGNIALQDSVVNQMIMNPNDFSQDELLRQAEIGIDSKKL